MSNTKCLLIGMVSGMIVLKSIEMVMDKKNMSCNKAMDGLEAVIQHNISDLSTWIPKEYELNKTYANDKVAFSDYLKELRQEILKDTLEKIGE